MMDSEPFDCADHAAGRSPADRQELPHGIDQIAVGSLQRCIRKSKTATVLIHTMAVVCIRLESTAHERSYPRAGSSATWTENLTES
jgi:hypothetical protein